MNRLGLFASAATFALTAVMVAGCGGGGGAATGPTAPSQSSSSGASGATPPSSTKDASTPADPCTLITAQEASTALGVDAGTPSGSAGGQCSYTTASGSLTIVDTHYPDGSTAQFSFNATRTAAMGGVPGFQDATGIGDRAFLTTTGLVEFEKGTTVVIIQILSSGNPTAATMTRLGQAAASRV